MVQNVWDKIAGNLSFVENFVRAILLEQVQKELPADILA